MIDKIMDVKVDVMDRLEKLIDERGLERMDAKELFDAIKDLSEAEYYCSVVEAMDDYGYMPEDGMGYDGQGGNRGGGSRGGGNRGGQSGYRSGYRGQSRDSTGRYTRRGYRGGRYGHDDMMMEVRQMMEQADPQEREQLKEQLRQMVQM